MPYDEDFSDNCPDTNTRRTAEIFKEMHEETRATRGDNYHRLYHDRALPDAHDVHRYLEASRKLAFAHARMLEAGRPDWLRDTALAPMLFRDSNLEHGECGPTAASSPWHVSMLADDIGDELGYLAVMCADALNRKQTNATHSEKVKRIGKAAALAILLFEVALRHPDAFRGVENLLNCVLAQTSETAGAEDR